MKHKIFLIISIFLCLLNSQSKTYSKELPFVIVISSYNNAKWVKKNLDSVFSQNYNNFRVIYVDDASQDGTSDRVEEYIQKHNVQHKVTLIKNTQRSMKLKNIYNAYYLCKDHELIAQVDGDDWLIHADVLTLLNTIFSNEDVWFSYGQFMHSTGKIGFCREIALRDKQNALFRQLPFVTTHLKVFYAWLFKMVKLQDLLVETVPGWEGHYYPYANDCATVFPMLEMARERVIFNSKIVYVFNKDNPISGHVSQLALQNACAREIKTLLPIYSKLDQPIFKRLDRLKTVPDCLVVSDNPYSLRATLRALEKYVQDVTKIIVWYQPQEKNDAMAYQELKQQFKNINFYNISTCTTENILRTLKKSVSHYILCMCDTIVLNAPLRCAKWIMELERTFAHACYGLLTCANFDENNIPYQNIQSDLYAWKFLCDKNKCINPSNFGLTLYRKEDVIAAYQGKKFQTLEDVVQVWTSTAVDTRKIGIFFGAVA